ncbi:MAG TPA: serine hydrolase domain-containing protein [Dehalococcoidia bacterium]
MQIDPNRTALSTERLERITEHLDRSYVSPGKIAGCQTLVARHGHVAYFKSLGLADRERGRPMTDDTIFRIYSMTKPITSVALMMLWEQGRFQLNDPIANVIPEWREMRVYVSGEGETMETREPARPMTFRHLLSHTGGLSYGMTDHPVDRAYGGAQVIRGRGETLRTFVERLAHVPLMYDPGDRWMYSYSTDVCGYLVEAISGEPFDQYLQEAIFDPLGMVDTAFFVKPEKAHRLAANYARQTDKTMVLIDDPASSTYLREPTFISGGGGLTSTTADYLRFAEMLRGGGELDGARIIGSRTLQLMTQNHLPGGANLASMAIGLFSETKYEGTGFGLGFATTIDQIAAGLPCEGEFFWGGAASTYFWVDPKDDLLAIFMTQLMPSTTFDFRGQLKDIVYSAIVD